VITLPEHPDVVFDKAPLVAVRCRATFSPVLSLMTSAGVAGIQEALRSEYPSYEERRRASFTFTNEIGIEHQPPVHSLQSQDGWRVDVTTTSVELSALGAAYSTSGEFLARFDRIAQVVARTVAPGPTSRLALSKENKLRHPDVKAPADWNGLLSSLLVQPFSDFAAHSPDGCRPHGASTLHFHGDDQILDVTYGVELQSPETFDLVISRWTDRPYDLESSTEMIDVLREFADGATSIFHFLLEDDMKAYLQPKARELA